jgi:hypothetical protein
MDSPVKLATLATQDTGRRQTKPKTHTYSQKTPTKIADYEDKTHHARLHVFTNLLRGHLWHIWVRIVTGF